jgi:hypothetical protein
VFVREVRWRAAPYAPTPPDQFTVSMSVVLKICHGREPQSKFTFSRGDFAAAIGDVAGGFLLSEYPQSQLITASKHAGFRTRYG